MQSGDVPQKLSQNWEAVKISGFKESDDSEEVILEPRLIAVEFIFLIV